MNNRYIVFDTETPNYANDRISAIALTVVERGQIIDEQFYLVNPESSFNSFNVRLTGITPQMVSDQPAFPELWQKIAPVMASGILVAHNAPFDMGVIAKCLRDYQLPWQRYVSYACTCRMGRVCYPHMYNHKLNTMCAELGIALDHHQAASDSRACAELLLDYQRQGLAIKNYIKTYDLLNICTCPGRRTATR